MIWLYVIGGIAIAAAVVYGFVYGIFYILLSGGRYPWER